jgi:hypothetical protein
MKVSMQQAYSKASRDWAMTLALAAGGVWAAYQLFGSPGAMFIGLGTGLAVGFALDYARTHNS